MFFSKGGGGGYLSLCPSPLDSFFDICQGVISMIYGVLFLLSKNLLPRSIPSICQDITSSGARTAFSGCQPVIILSSEGFEKPGSDLSSNIWKTNNGQQWSNKVKTMSNNVKPCQNNVKQWPTMSMGIQTTQLMMMMIVMVMMWVVDPWARRWQHEYKSQRTLPL